MTIDTVIAFYGDQSKLTSAYYFLVSLNSFALQKIIPISSI